MVAANLPARVCCPGDQARLLETVMTARKAVPAHAAPTMRQGWQVVALVNTVVWTLMLATLWTAFDILIARWRH